MKTINQLLLTTAIVLTSLASAVHAAPALTVQILGTFDYPGATSTSPIGINDRGEISGYYLDANNVTRGFIRLRNGNFRPPLVEPNDNGNSTRGQRINHSRVVCGFYSGNSNLHGFLFARNVFTEFNIPGALSTFIFALNDAGNFVGSYGDLSTLSAYVNLGGVTSTFTVGGSGVTEPLGINNANEIVGFYFDPDFNAHGFFRDASGGQTFPMDFPGSAATFLVDLNDNGLKCGSYSDSTGGTHAFVLTSTGQSVSFDYPGATDTGANGINNDGMICGRYTDSAGVPHGYFARAR